MVYGRIRRFREGRVGSHSAATPREAGKPTDKRKETLGSAQKEVRTCDELCQRRGVLCLPAYWLRRNRSRAYPFSLYPPAAPRHRRGHRLLATGRFAIAPPLLPPSGFRAFPCSPALWERPLPPPITTQDSPCPLPVSPPPTSPLPSHTTVRSGLCSHPPLPHPPFDHELIPLPLVHTRTCSGTICPSYPPLLSLETKAPRYARAHPSSKRPLKCSSRLHTAPCRRPWQC